jgi:hypothetical protein
LLLHFQSNAGCPYTNPEDSIIENNRIAGSSLPSSPLQEAPAAPFPVVYSATSCYAGDEEDCTAVERYSSGSSLLLLAPSSLQEAPPSPVDSNAEDILDEISSTEESDDSSIIGGGVEADADYPPQAARLILQQDSDLTDEEDDEENDHGNDIFLLDSTGSDLNQFLRSWKPPTPNNLRPIAEDILISPVKESLLCLLTENNLPKRLYASIMEWGHYASSQDYDFIQHPTYQTILGRMLKKYSNVSGGPPLSEVVDVPNQRAGAMNIYPKN